MLTVLENFLLTAVSSVLPKNTKVVAGIIPTPLATELPLVNVIANNLHTLNDANSEDTKRTPAFFTQRLKFTGNGKKLDFPLPKDINGNVLEVELTAGRLAKSGDDYWQDAQILHFYSAPTTTFSILIQGNPAQGYQQLSPCSISLSIDVWSDTLTTADNLLGMALAASLSALTDLDRLELARIDRAGFSLRLMKPLAELSRLERNPKAGDTLFCSIAELRLHSELEMTLALGVPVLQGIMQTIEGRLLTTNNQASEHNFKINKQSI